MESFQPEYSLNFATLFRGHPHNMNTCVTKLLTNYQFSHKLMKNISHKLIYFLPLSSQGISEFILIYIFILLFFLLNITPLYRETTMALIRCWETGRTQATHKHTPGFWPSSASGLPPVSSCQPAGSHSSQTAWTGSDVAG